MAFLAERLLLLGLVAWLIIWLWQRLRWQRQRQRLETIFYELLRRQKGKITLIQLVAESRMEPEITRSFLKEQAQFFGAILTTDEQGNDYYQFPPV